MKVTTEDLRNIVSLLKEMVRIDQEMRDKYFDAVKIGKPDLYYFDSSIDERNTFSLKEIIKKLGGWPTISRVGEEAAHNAWLLAQHADHDPVFQQYCLDLMLAEKDNVIARDIAYLTDRLAVKKRAPQTFGTQFSTDENGKLIKGTIFDLENLDKRRASVGLEPFDSYLQTARETYDPK